MSDPKSTAHTDDAPAAGEENGPATGSPAQPDRPANGSPAGANGSPAQPGGIAAQPDGIAMDEAALGNEALMLVAETSEGQQELSRRTDTGPGELRREVGAVLRMPEGQVIDPSDIDIERSDDETMIINMGPQHPSTHGVLRLMIELDGETVLRTKPVVGYLHTGMEKTGEELTYVQGATNVTRMDYLAPLHNELVFSLATEALLGVEMPERATWIRMLMVELNRLSSHLMWMATNGMDLGSTSMMIYGFREREMVLAFFEKATGLRMNHNFIRPGGVAADLPDGWEDDVSIICDTILPRTDEYDELLTGQPIFRERTEGIGRISAEEALALSLTGPILRSTGVPWDLRRSMPYLAYEEVDFDVIVGTYGDNFDRYSIRLNEIRESVKIVRQIVEKMPLGDYRVQDKKVTPPPRARIDESMEALIHHFKVFTEGFKVPEGEVYVAVESPRGELGCYLVSDGSSKPYRMHIRGPSFVNLQGLPVIMRGGLIADAIADISSIDPVMGEVDR
jgi:NADH-quinone oxidoreductase subunit D